MTIASANQFMFKPDMHTNMSIFPKSIYHWNSWFREVVITLTRFDTLKYSFIQILLWWICVSHLTLFIPYSMSSSPYFTTIICITGGAWAMDNVIIPARRVNLFTFTEPWDGRIGIVMIAGHRKISSAADSQPCDQFRYIITSHVSNDYASLFLMKMNWDWAWLSNHVHWLCGMWLLLLVLYLMTV